VPDAGRFAAEVKEGQGEGGNMPGIDQQAPAVMEVGEQFGGDKDLPGTEVAFSEPVDHRQNSTGLWGARP